MDIIVAIITSLITAAILGYSEIDKTSRQLMLLGLEITIIGTLLILIAFFISSSTCLFLVGEALTIIGFMVNLFGFRKK